MNDKGAWENCGWLITQRLVPVALGFMLFVCAALLFRYRRLCSETLVKVPGGTVTIGSREVVAARPPQEVSMPSFFMGRHEVTVAEYARFLNETGADTSPCREIIRQSARFKVRWGCGAIPVTGVSRDDAAQYCRWLSQRTGWRVRLPTEAEWEHAARGGIHGARFPWGWGDPRSRAQFAADGPCRVGRYAENGFGLQDMAGNVFEWCADFLEGGGAPARGGSWAERDPQRLYVFCRTVFPSNYRGRDVGFRILVEADGVMDPGR